jgi:hypothetical protein
VEPPKAAPPSTTTKRKQREEPPPAIVEPPKTSKRALAAKTTSVPRGAQLEANGQHQIWNTRAPLTDKFMHASDYKLACKSSDGTLAFYVTQQEPIGGSFNAWLPFLQTQWNMALPKKTRGDIMVFCTNGDALPEELQLALIANTKQAAAAGDGDDYTDNSAIGDDAPDVEPTPQRPRSARQRDREQRKGRGAK